LRRLHVSIILKYCRHALIFTNIEGNTLKTIYEIQQYLKKFGTIIYIGDRVSDLEFMESELKELFNSQLIETSVYQNALLLLRHEIQLEKEKTANKKR
jgi:uncharacterized protein YqgQ